MNQVDIENSQVVWLLRRLLHYNPEHYFKKHSTLRVCLNRSKQLPRVKLYNYSDYIIKLKKPMAAM